MSSTCCRTKRGCFAKSSPNTQTRDTENVYDLEPVADRSSSASHGQGAVDDPVPPSAAEAGDRTYYNDSAAVSAMLAPTSSNGQEGNIPGAGEKNNYQELFTGDSSSAPGVQYDALWNVSNQRNNPHPDPPPQSASESESFPQREDSGLTLVDNSLYESSGSKPNDNAM